MITPADLALLQRTIATLRVAGLMPDAVPALVDLQARLASACQVEREVPVPLVPEILPKDLRS